MQEVFNIVLHNLKAIREDTDTKQKTIASYLGVSQNTYSQYENGVIAISPEMLVKTADYFNVSVDYLLGRTQNKKLYK
jgi:Predicted transcriptional regulators